MTQALDIKPDSTILEIGTGSGYQAAVLSRLARNIHSVERIESLAHAAEFRLGELGIYNVRIHISDGSVGLQEFAPFDRIIVTAAAPATPQPLVDQLAEGGKLVIPVGDENQQQLLLVTRNDHRIVEQPLIACRFVKLIGIAGWAAS